MLGQVVSHYRILEQLGGGGMGVVYRAEDVRLGRQVAIKFLPPGLSRDATAAEHFRREARAASALNHPNICTVYDLGEHEGQQFLVMELLDGGTLKHLIDGRALDNERTVELGIEIADALEAAHAHGIVSDIRPANISSPPMATQSCSTSVWSSWPLGEVAGSRRRSADDDGRRHVRPRQGCSDGNSRLYVARASRGVEVDVRTDLFSFGLVINEMATGRRPSFEGFYVATLDAVLHAGPPRRCG